MKLDPVGRDSCLGRAGSQKNATPVTRAQTRATLRVSLMRAHATGIPHVFTRDPPLA